MNDQSRDVPWASRRNPLVIYRRIESSVYQQLAEELREAGHSIDAGTLAWAVDTATERLRRATGVS